MNKAKIAALAMTFGVSGALSGCALLETLAPYANTVSTQVLMVGLVNPLQDIELPDTLAMAVFVSDAASISDIENAPITEAVVEMLSGAFSTTLGELESGLYWDTAGEDEGAVYEGGMDYQVTINHGTEVFTASATASDPTGFEEDRSCVAAGQASTLTLTGGPYERVLVAVYDTDGNETFSNIPVTTDEMVDFVKEGDADLTFQLPASAFPEEDAVYAVAVAGINQGGTYSDNLNPVLSLFYLGAGQVGAIGTFSDEAQCELAFSVLE